MEGLENMVRNATKDFKLSNLSTKASSISDLTGYSSNGGAGLGAALSSSSSDQSRILFPRATRLLGEAKEETLVTGEGACEKKSMSNKFMVLFVIGNMVSVWTCSKLCAISFAVGVIAGYTLKRRVRRWASRLLRRLKDD